MATKAQCMPNTEAGETLLANITTQLAFSDGTPGMTAFIHNVKGATRGWEPYHYDDRFLDHLTAVTINVHYVAEFTPPPITHDLQAACAGSLILWALLNIWAWYAWRHGRLAKNTGVAVVGDADAEGHPLGHPPVSDGETIKQGTSTVQEIGQATGKTLLQESGPEKAAENKNADEVRDFEDNLAIQRNPSQKQTEDPQPLQKYEEAPESASSVSTPPHATAPSTPVHSTTILWGTPSTTPSLDQPSTFADHGENPHEEHHLNAHDDETIQTNVSIARGSASSQEDGTPVPSMYSDDEEQQDEFPTPSLYSDDEEQKDDIPTPPSYPDNEEEQHDPQTPTASAAQLDRLVGLIADVYLGRGEGAQMGMDRVAASAVDVFMGTYNGRGKSGVAAPVVTDASPSSSTTRGRAADSAGPISAAGACRIGTVGFSPRMREEDRTE